MAAVAPALSPGSYTWTFPGCPIQIRLRLEIVVAFERLLEQAQDSGRPAPFSGGLLIGDTANPGVTEIAGMEPLAALDATTVEAAIGKAECEVVGFFRAVSGSSLQPGASLRITEDDAALATGFFHQPSSVVLLIETVEATPAKAAFFFWDGGKMLGDFSLMDFPLDPQQLAALERQRTAPRRSQQIDQELRLGPADVPAAGEGSRWQARAAWAVGALAILGMATYFYATRLGHRVSDARQTAAAAAPASPLGFRVDRQGTDLLLSWDRHSPAVASATFGVVLIRENDRTRNVALTAEQLRSGSVRYKPAFDEVDIELNVAAGDHLVKESVIAVLPGLNNAPAAQP
jgi:hypothetical protein